MRWLSYILFLCVLIAGKGEWLFDPAIVYGETIPTIDKNSQPMSVAEEQEITEESAKDIRIKKDEFDEIVGQLQGMKSLLEKMKQDYDARFEEMQEKIATLEKQKSKLEREKIEWKMEKTTDVGTNSNIQDASAINESIKSKENIKENENPPAFPLSKEIEGGFVGLSNKDKEEKPMQPQAETTTTPPLPTQVTTESMPSPANTTASDQPGSSGTAQWSPAQPISLWSSGKSYMNISFDALFAAAGSTAKDLGTIETGGHDPNQRGFTAQNLETVFEGAVDPYFKGLSVLVFQIDKQGESFLEVEEAYLTSMSLPLNLQVKAGTFFTEFGRLNQFHPHAWDFADQPLVNGRFLGPDGLRNPGARISWLAPTDNYTELFFTVQDSQGGTAFSFRNPDALFGRTAVDTGVRNIGDMLYVPRITTSFDLTEEQTILLGASAAFGPNSTGPNENTLIYGLDMFWKWKSKYASGGFPFVTWQTEVMGRRFEAGADINANLPAEVMNNWGAYSQVAWGFKKRWVAALRGDYVDGEKGATDPLGFERWRLSPNITFYPSEFSKIRLQYNYDDIIGNNSTEHSVFLQFEFLLGSHGAHKF